MNKTISNLPELAHQAAKDKDFRDLLFWKLVTLHPDAFLRLVNGEPMVSYEGPRSSNDSYSINNKPQCMMVDYRRCTLPVDTDLFCNVRDHATAGRKVDAIKLLRARAGIGLKEAKDFVEGTFPYPTRL